MNILARIAWSSCVFTVACASALAAEPSGYAMDDSFRSEVESLSRAMAQGGTTQSLQQTRMLVRTADQPYEKYVAGQLMLQAAAQVSDLRAEREALNVILESGAVPAARMPTLRAMAGSVSAVLGDRKDAAAQIAYANQLGLVTAASQFAMADAQFQLGNADAATAALDQAIALRAQGGNAVPKPWYDRAVALSYQAKRPDLAARWAAAKLRQYAEPADWRSALVNYMARTATPPEQSLDLYRLMAATDALASGRDWQAYASIAAGQGANAEAKAALDSAIRAGDLESSDPAVKKALATLTPKAKKSLAAVTAKTPSSGLLAMADAQFAAASYSAAVASYRTAMMQGSGDKDRIATRLGIALARSGDLAGGKAALAQVTASPWAPVAGFWGVWIDRQIARNPA